jgi:hypothetical protein
MSDLLATAAMLVVAFAMVWVYIRYIYTSHA